ncbi:MAG: hypothetical protein M4579_003334 [Chaenotheca gracillima]|nr:MAG: hypothetical protein M4579_003334 [Chaenotheca gracillima]
MAGSASNSFSHLSRYKPALVFLTTLTAACGIYYLHSQYYETSPPQQSPTSLRRRGAIHRRSSRRRGDGRAQAGHDEQPANVAGLMSRLTSFYDSHAYNGTTRDGRQLVIPLDPLTLPTSQGLQDQHALSSEEAQEIRAQLEQQFLNEYLPVFVGSALSFRDEARNNVLEALRDELISNRGFDSGAWERAIERFTMESAQAIAQNDAPTENDQERPDAEGHVPIVDPESESSYHGGGGGGDTRSSKHGENLLKLLYHIAEEQARREGYVHRGVTCNSCGTMPILGIRYRCTNCVDFDLCETCEALQAHPKTHLFYKVRIPAPFLSNPRQAQPVWYPGKPEGLPQSLYHTLKSRLVTETGFESSEVEAMWDQFRCLAATEWVDDPNRIGMAIDRKTFDKCFAPASSSRPPPPNLIYDRTFAFYDTNSDGLIGFEEFLRGLACLNNKTKEEKLKRIFRGYDIDGDGWVDRKDFLRIFRAFYALSKELSRDMISGAEDDVVEGVNVRDIVLSSQPLSSAFTGHIPPGERSRTANGKEANGNGDMEIMDDEGVVLESGDDTTDRYGILADAAERRAAESSTFPRRQWESMIVPTEENNALDLVLDEAVEWTARHRRQTDPDRGDREDETDDGEDVGIDGAAEAMWSLEWVGPEDFQTVGLPTNTRFEELETTKKKEVVEAAKARLNDERMRRINKIRQDGIQERWERRQFYLDDEEGAIQPHNFDEPDYEDDAPPLANVKFSEDDNANIPPSEPVSRPPSPRSRSSSKVRFQDDVNDNDDVRSNPSTSSRSIPVGERWGGFEIPEAEKDVGKEILYQVIQQGMIEMLDPLFRRKEDLALEASATREEREKYKDFIQNVIESKKEEVGTSKMNGIENGKAKQNGTANGTVEESRKENEDLEPQNANSANDNTPLSPESIHRAAEGLRALYVNPLGQTPPTSAQIPSNSRPASRPASPIDDTVLDPSTLSLPLPTLLQQSGYSSVEGAASPPVIDVEQSPRSQAPPPDPTLPQNRPSFVKSSPPSSPPPRSPASPPPDITLPQHRPSHPPPPSELTEGSARIPPASQRDPSSRLSLLSGLPTFASRPTESRLRRLRLLSRIDQEIKTRGGPGRIGFEEFRRAMLGEPAPSDGDDDVESESAWAGRDKRGAEHLARTMAFFGGWVEMASF